MAGSTIWARSTLESDVFYWKPDKWFKIWFFLVNRVNHKDSKQFKRGECFTTYKEIANFTKASRDQIDKFIRWAKEQSMATTRKTTRGMIVFLPTYAKYQDSIKIKSDTPDETKANQKRIKSDTINKNNKNIYIYGAKAQFNLDGMPIQLEDLEDNGITYEALDQKTPKKYGNKRKLLARLAIYLMKLKGEEGNVLRYFPDIKELIDKAEKEDPESVEREVKSRILVFKTYQEKNGMSWSSNGIVKNWNAIKEKYFSEVESLVDLKNL